MDGPQMDAYYGDQLYVLERAIDDLSGVNWNGLHHWLSAKATWTDPPLRPDRLAIIREHAVKLCDVSNQDRDPASSPLNTTDTAVLGGPWDEAVISDGPCTCEEEE